jgi:NADH:ubiquinone oxidoreductase subunit 3 (subunit A)
MMRVPRASGGIRGNRATRAYGERVLILVIVLLVLWAILAVVGFAIKGLVWLAVIGIILFLATVVIGFVRRSTVRGRAKP